MEPRVFIVEEASDPGTERPHGVRIMDLNAWVDCAPSAYGQDALQAAASIMTLKGYRLISHVRLDDYSRRSLGEPLSDALGTWEVMAEQVRRPLTEDENADNAHLVQLYVNTLANGGVSVQSDALALLYEFLKVRFEGMPVDGK